MVHVFNVRKTFRLQLKLVSKLAQTSKILVLKQCVFACSENLEVAKRVLRAKTIIDCSGALAPESGTI